MTLLLPADDIYSLKSVNEHLFRFIVNRKPFLSYSTFVIRKNHNTPIFTGTHVCNERDCQYACLNDLYWGVLVGVSDTNVGVLWEAQSVHMQK